MKITITIDTNNASFKEAPELETKRILESVGLKFFTKGLVDMPLFDDKGDIVGYVTVEGA